MQTLTLDSRPRQLPMKVRSCGSQPANISLINRREGVSVSAHARVRKRRDGKKHSGLINPASAEAHHISRLLRKEPEAGFGNRIRLQTAGVFPEPATQSAAVLQALSVTSALQT